MNAPNLPPATLAPRAVPLANAFAWFEAALRIFKAAPWRWCALGLVTLGSQLLLQMVPGVGNAAAWVIVPVVECGMLLGAAAVDRGAPLEIGFALAAFRAPATALAAIVVAAQFDFAVATLVAYSQTGANLLADPTDARVTTSVAFVAEGAATLASLPVLFVPLAALLQRLAFGRAFATSARAFALNVAPLLLYGVLSLLLTAIGVLLAWIGLIAVYPLLAIATYVAWKDIYGGGTALTPS